MWCGEPFSQLGVGVWDGFWREGRIEGDIFLRAVRRGGRRHDLGSLAVGHGEDGGVNWT